MDAVEDLHLHVLEDPNTGQFSGSNLSLDEAKEQAQIVYTKFVASGAPFEVLYMPALAIISSPRIVLSLID